ncbi:hypothetical protein [Burkholderia sp. Ax-1719]|uniref:hypothetical protein n=1 Tax=Burkholderia sp. Ax-1719 TaxID=2608334 RepID=UPI00141F4220|nr:hypothetical protein [Burkholderia sp. Ax-1719]NIE63145.1 hypothetical protein [Burkholderia sp. Ax-1719]
MVQHILAANALPKRVATISGPLSRQEIAARKVIDVDALLPGDLVLTSEVTPGFVASSIRRVQGHGGYGHEHARWEHAAIYLGDGIVCEATRRGVNRQPLSHYVGSHDLRFRRDLGLTSDERYRVAIAALSFSDYSYNLWEIFRLIGVAHRGFGNKSNSVGRSVGFPKRAVICSELFADSYAKVTKRIVGNIAGGEVTPASLSADDTLSDVSVSWLAIPGRQEGDVVAQ